MTNKSGPTYDSVKDSGDRHDFGTGSVRDRRTGKGLFHLVPTMPLKRLAVHFENGAKKYGERNWEKGQPLSSYYDSCQRHLLDVHDGKTDEDHEAAVLWNMVCLMQTREWIRQGKLPGQVEQKDGTMLYLNDIQLQPTHESFDLPTKKLTDPIDPVIPMSDRLRTDTFTVPPVYHGPFDDKRVYVSGPITGIADNNIPAFKKATKMLRDRNDGIEVFDPTERDNYINTDGFTWADYLALDIPEVCAADCLVVLPGWGYSKGCLAEMFVALILGKPVFEASKIKLLLELNDSDPKANWNHLLEIFESYRNDLMAKVLANISREFTVSDDAGPTLYDDKNEYPNMASGDGLS